MSIDNDTLHALPISEKMRIVELLWDDLGDSKDPIPLPQWAEREAARRRDEMRDPACGISHDEAWKRIERRHG